MSNKSHKLPPISTAHLSVDYRRKVTVPIRDMAQGGEVVFLVDVYGVGWKDMAVVPGGTLPMIKAVERLGFNPYRYQATIWDLS